MSDLSFRNRLSRRLFLGQTLGLSTAVLAACGGAPAATPTPAAKPTTAPVPTAAPAIAAKPAEPTKPAAAAEPTKPAAAPAAATQAPAATPAPVAKPSTAGVMRPPEPNPKRGGKVTFAWGVTTAHFDIHQGGGPANILWHTYNNLVRLNLADGLKTIIPDMAESWEISSDNKVYTFKLRSGVKWHNGVDFSADDVLATFNRILTPPEGVVSVFKARFGYISKVEAPDKSTIRFTLSAPRAYFLELLTSEPGIIYPKKTLDENKGDLKKVIAPGTGAYIFKDHKVGEKWTLERNPNYWDKELPYVDTLEFIHAPAWTDRGTAVLSGQADHSWNVALDTFEEGQKRKDIVSTFRLPSPGAYIIYLNCAKKPFDDPKVRRAVHLGLNRQAVYEAFKTQEPMNYSRYTSHGSEYATPPADVLKLPGYRADKKEDIDVAKKLLAEAGYKDGIQGLDLLVATVAPHSQVMAPSVQASLKANLGIESTIRAVERAVLNDEQRNGKYDLCVNTFTPNPLYDPTLGWIDAFKTKGSQNLSQYSNPKIDKMIDELDAETDSAKRKKLIGDIEDILDGEPPWLTVGFTDHLLMWRNHVKGMAFEKRVRNQWGKADIIWVDK